mgnify:CR=1 FL=1|jgi:uncharacterized OsmC-like protein/alpha/beta superfamily hydrolase
MKNTSRVERVEFSNQEGRQLSAIIDFPSDRHPHSFVLFAHCFTCNKNFTAVRNIARALTTQGFGVMRFDFTGLGESEGEFATTNFSSNVSDLVCAADYLSIHHKAPTLLIGHSLGGSAAIVAGSQIDSIRAISTIGAPSDPAHVRQLIQSGVGAIEAEGEAEINIGGRPFIIRQQFLEDIAAQKLTAILKDLRKPIMVLHSPQDTIVGIENAAEIYKSAWHPKSFISLDGADHLLSNSRDSRYAGQMIATWAMKYAELEVADTILSNYDAAALITGGDGYTTRIKLGTHEIVADEPVSAGGFDFGPSPYELVSAGLAACTAMTMKMYANRKEWKIDEIVVHVKHDRRHIDDCVDCEDPKLKIDYFDKKIELKGDLDEAQRQRILDIASRCPVHKTLLSEIRISTEHN